jgi:uncharacterized RDD family membrane protein YckC
MNDSQLQQKRLAAAAIDFAILIAFMVLMIGVGWAIVCSGAMTEIDGMAGHIIYSLLVVAWAFASLGYVLGRDVLAGDRSLGKKVMGLRVVTVSGAPIGFVESAKRNALFAPGFAVAALASLIQAIPLVGCLACLLLPLRVLATVAGLVALVYELVLIFVEPDGVRLGDKMAGTRVVI